MRSHIFAEDVKFAADSRWVRGGSRAGSRRFAAGSRRFASWFSQVCSGFAEVCELVLAGLRWVRGGSRVSFRRLRWAHGGLHQFAVD